ncbi:MAG: ABC transporter ATP-binding protein [Planctomycetota bacterium]
MTAFLDVRDLRASYDAVEAVHGITFRVEAGEIVALLGANGAGKSTTLMAISGVLPGAGGAVDFDGRSLSGLPAHAIVGRGISQVPEGRRIFARLTIRENLLLGAYLRRDEAGIRDDLERVLDMFPRLRERLSQKGGTLSGGEQQMLAIARGLMARPKLLLLDEPSLGLAPILVQQIFDILRRIRDQGVSLLLVEQNARMALKLANRAYVLETGRISLSGIASELEGREEIRRAYLGG